ncbi:MAG: molybdopterin-dependent oxidoreductase [Desulfobacteraceae bacterium]|nr:molybdopterin-dependent oxidoreductase [Desulfobacteraceae bacterium]MBC2756797.1 molybdopterin-dependent oxidoreductase [Desulfobacteraceae bacterium]
MSQWHKTGCVLCAQNCGLEVLVEDNRMVKVKPDKSNLRSEGYACRKGLNVIYHQYPKDRLTEPLKRTGDRFEPISWEKAIDEIAEKMKALVDTHGPRCLSYMGASAQGGHFEGAFGLSILKAMGSQYFYNSGGQEFSGSWWLFGRMLGKQYNVAMPDDHATEMLVGWGWNGMESHQMPQAPKILKGFSKDPDRLLVIIDPRKSETASIANIHLAIRPGTDALLIKAMISIILDKQWENKEYINNYVEGWDTISPWFEHFDAKAAIKVCELDYDQVVELCRLMTTKRWCMHPDLGIYMGRRSTLNSYLMNVLGTVCGIFCLSGGNVIPGMVMPMGYHADERDPKTWRTIMTNMPPASAGSFPPAVMPEEILNDHPERLRAVFVSACNPLRSYPDTTAYEEAFGKLGLVPEIPDELQEAAKGDRLTFGAKLMEWAATEPKSLAAMPFVMAKTLGKEWDSAALAALWGVLMTAPKAFRKNATRIGFEPGLDQGDRIFQALLDHPEGLWVGEVDPDENFKAIKTPSGKIEVYIPELEDDTKKLDAANEAKNLRLPDEFPMILNAGRHTKYNINTMMRNPEWNKGKRTCTVSINPADAESMDFTDGQQVKVTTEAGSEVSELQVSDQIRQGTILIPHEFGLIYDGSVYGINVNRLTKNTHRDPMGTPLHRFVPCRVEAA